MISAFIQGLSPVLPILSIILILALSLFVAWWSYQHLESIPRGKKVWLVLLRGIRPLFAGDVAAQSVFLPDSKP
jgi:hypothetical protein